MTGIRIGEKALGKFAATVSPVIDSFVLYFAVQHYRTVLYPQISKNGLARNAP